MEFKDYNNAFEGKTAYIIGKGPVFDLWKSAGFPVLPDSIVCGVNDTPKHAPIDYVFTTDGYHQFADGRKDSFIGLPTRAKSFNKRKKHNWFLHCHDIIREGGALRLNRDMIAETRWLYTASSSVQPAIHFAWYTGCKKIIMVGVGDPVGVGQSFQGGVVDTPAKYKMLWDDTKKVCNFLYGKNWVRWDDMYGKWRNIQKGLT
jgi:hypothetical protein